MPSDGDRLREAVHKYGEVFSAGTVPISLIDIADSVDVLAFGERHYKQEHQEFLGVLARHLQPHGLRLIVGELMHAYSWVVDDYVTGVIDSIPEEIRFFDNAILSELRLINQNLPLSEMIHYAYIDMNHWDTNFLESAKWMERYRGSTGLFSTILAVDPMSEAYSQELYNLKSLLEAEETCCRLQLGDHWYEQIGEMVDIEIRSVELRKVDYDSAKREPIMTDLLTLRFNEHPGLKIANCGWNHMQKKHYDGPGGSYELVGEYLYRHHRSFHVGFSALRGERRKGFRDNTQCFNTLDFAGPDDLMRIASEKQGMDNLFLTLGDSIFDQELLVADVNQVSPVRLKQQFDALIVYPEVHILRSMMHYDQCSAIVAQRQRPATA